MVDYKGWIKKQESDLDYENYHIKKRGMSGYIPKESFFIDGIICEEEYKNAGNKVLYIAKECNAWEYDKQNVVNKENRLNMSEFFVRKELKKGDKTKNRFLKGMAMLHNAIINNDYSTPNKNISSLSSSAMINLNKRGGYSWCIWNTLEKYVEEYQEYLRNQISAINPDVIVCCGESVKYLVDKYSLAEECIDIRCAYHPSYFLVSDVEKLRFLKKDDSKSPAENTIAQESSNTKAQPRGVRGYILDTNNRWEGQETEQDMLVNKRACAYGKAIYQLGWIKEKDYILFYSSNKKGIVAVGQATNPGNCDEADSAWWEINLKAPKEFKKGTTALEMLPMEEVNSIVYSEEAGKKICMRGTVKRKIITEDQVVEIIDRLNKKYDQTK